MYVGLKQPRGDGERYVTPARAAAKETILTSDYSIYNCMTSFFFSILLIGYESSRHCLVRRA